MFHVKHFAEIFMNSTLDMKIKRNFRECRNGEKMARGLGKGIDVLIPEVKHSTGKDEKKVVKEVVKEVLKETNEIDINKVEPNENQPRKEFNEDALQELADSIKQHGLIEPIIVQEGKKGFYQIIAGERRWRAARLAGLKKVPAIVKEYTDQEIMEIALIENIQREDLNPIEEAEAYQRLISEYKLKQDEVADKVSKSRVAITNALRLLKLDERVRRMVVEDKIKSGHARALLSIKDGELQYETALQIFDGNLTVRETEKLVKKLLEEPKPSKKEDVEINKQLQIIYEQYEEKLKNKLGTKVKINQKNNGKGKIEIEYYSADDLTELLRLSHKSNGGKNKCTYLNNMVLI